MRGRSSEYSTSMPTPPSTSSSRYFVMVIWPATMRGSAGCSSMRHRLSARVFLRCAPSRAAHPWKPRGQCVVTVALESGTCVVVQWRMFSAKREVKRSGCGSACVRRGLIVGLGPAVGLLVHADDLLDELARDGDVLGVAEVVRADVVRDDLVDRHHSTSSERHDPPPTTAVTMPG